MTRVLLAIVLALGLAGCSRQSSGPYDGPDVTSIVVHKGARKLYLLNGNDVLRSYPIALGFAPEGPKRVELDGRTPEGAYRIWTHNPNSAYHLSLGISYPDRADVARARALGKPPGGDIFIHGTPDDKLGTGDWTYGCIAVTNSQIEEIYAMVPNGTPIFIEP